MPSESDLPPEARIERWARSWGAEDISLVGTQGLDGKLQVDFRPPLPGHQPIKSGISLDGDKIFQATIRYGVLDAETFPSHPTDDPEQLDRMKMLATRSPLPDTGVVVVNYGDTHRAPRPHLLLGWRPSIATDDEVVIGDDAERLYAIDPSLELFEQFGEHVRREFRGEWDPEAG